MVAHMGLNFEVWSSLNTKNTSKIPWQNSKSQFKNVPHRKHDKYTIVTRSERKLQENTNAAKIRHAGCIVYFNQKLNANSHGCTHSWQVIFKTWLMNI